MIRSKIGFSNVRASVSRVGTSVKKFVRNPGKNVETGVKVKPSEGRMAAKGAVIFFSMFAGILAYANKTVKIVKPTDLKTIERVIDSVASKTNVKIDTSKMKLLESRDYYVSPLVDMKVLRSDFMNQRIIKGAKQRDTTLLNKQIIPIVGKSFPDGEGGMKVPIATYVEK